MIAVARSVPLPRKTPAGSPRRVTPSVARLLAGLSLAAFGLSPDLGAAAGPSRTPWTTSHIDGSPEPPKAPVRERAAAWRALYGKLVPA